MAQHRRLWKKGVEHRKDKLLERLPVPSVGLEGSALLDADAREQDDFPRGSSKPPPGGDPFGVTEKNTPDSPVCVLMGQYPISDQAIGIISSAS